MSYGWGNRQTTSSTTTNKPAWGGTTTKKTSVLGGTEEQNGWGGNDQPVGKWGQKTGAGAWAEKPQDAKKTTTSYTGKTSYGSAAGGNNGNGTGTAWGALKTYLESQAQARKPTSSTGFGSRAGYRGTGTYSTAGRGTTGAYSYQGTGAGTSGTASAGTSKFSYGRTSLAAMPPEGTYLTSKGQPFLSNTIVEETGFQTNGENIPEYECFHICSTTRFESYTVEALRYYDYIVGGGITWVDPEAAQKKTAYGTGQYGQRGTTLGRGTGLTAEKPPKNYDVWKLQQTYYGIDIVSAESKLPSNTRPFGSLPTSQLTMSRDENEEFECEEDIEVTPRGFLPQKTLFESMHDYSGRSHTPGLTALVPRTLNTVYH